MCWRWFWCSGERTRLWPSSSPGQPWRFNVGGVNDQMNTASLLPKHNLLRSLSGSPVGSNIMCNSPLWLWQISLFASFFFQIVSLPYFRPILPISLILWVELPPRERKLPLWVHGYTKTCSFSFRPLLKVNLLKNRKILQLQALSDLDFLTKFSFCTNCCLIISLYFMSINRSKEN